MRSFSAVRSLGQALAGQVTQLFKRCSTLAKRSAGVQHWQISDVSGRCVARLHRSCVLDWHRDTARCSRAWMCTIDGVRSLSACDNRQSKHGVREAKFQLEQATTCACCRTFRHAHFELAPRSSGSRSGAVGLPRLNRPDHANDETRKCQASC